MKLSKIITLFALLFAVGALVMSLAAACPAPAGEQNPSQIELEDCDAEDWRNYEPECGRKSPKPMKTAKQPAPKPTKRR